MGVYQNSILVSFPSVGLNLSKVWIMYPPLCLSLVSAPISVRPESCNKDDAKNPCLKIPDSLCSPHICTEIIAPNYPSTTMSLYKIQTDDMKGKIVCQNLEEGEGEHTSQWTTSSRLTIVQLVQNHFTISTCCGKGSQSLSSSSSLRSWLYISSNVISFCCVAFFCRIIKFHM